MSKSRLYKVSVVMPVYNTMEYMEEAIQSIVKQTIGFENIQLILVNNGADEKTHDICVKYKYIYPDNVEYIRFKHNKGVSAARNAGKNIVKGKYVNFLDSDDKWDIDAYEIMYEFFEEMYTSIDFVSARIKYFEGRNDWHGLDWKFIKEKELVDLKKTPEKVQLNVGASFIKTKILQDYSFDESVRHAEDAKFLSEIVINKMRYGLVRRAVFNYRIRAKGNSVLQNVHTSIDWYTGTMENVYLYLMIMSKKIYGFVVPYIQWLVMYELQWRLPIPLPKDFTEENKNEYVGFVKQLLYMIDDEIILKQRCLWDEYKIYAISMKYNKLPILNEDIMGIMVGKCTMEVMNKITYIDKIWQDNGIVQLSGFIRYCVPVDNLKLVIKIDGMDKVELVLSKLEDARQVWSFGERLTYGKKFNAYLKNKTEKVEFITYINNKKIQQYPYVFRSVKTNVEYSIDGKRMIINV